MWPTQRFRYLFWQLVGPVGVALAVLLGLLWLLQSLRFLDLIINRGLGVGTFLQFTVLLLPQLLTIVLPLAFIIGVAYALRRWQDDAETTAWLATGQHPATLAAPVMAAALAAAGLGLGLYWWLLPHATTTFKNMQFELRQQQGQLLLEPGSFNQLGDDLMIYLQKRLGPTHMAQLLVHDTRNPARPVTWYAQTGEVLVTPDGTPLLRLQNGLRQEVVAPATPGAAPTSSLLQFTSYQLNILTPFQSEQLLKRSLEIEEYSAAELRHPATTDPDLRAELRAEWHKRFLWPLSTLGLAALALGCLLRPATRATSTGRQLVAVGVGSLLLLASLFGLHSQAAQGQVWALWGQWALLPVAMLAAWWWRWKGLV